VISSSQKPLLAQQKWTQETKAHPLSGIRNHNSSNKAAADCTATESGSEITNFLLLSSVVKQSKNSSSSTAWPFNIGPIVRPEASVTNYQSMVHLRRTKISTDTLIIPIYCAVNIVCNSDITEDFAALNPWNRKSPINLTKKKKTSIGIHTTTSSVKQHTQ